MDRPKSASLTSRCRPSSMFSGLMSRWMTPADWQCASACVVCRKQDDQVAHAQLTHKYVRGFNGTVADGLTSARK